MFGSVASMLDMSSKETGMIDYRKVIYVYACTISLLSWKQHFLITLFTISPVCHDLSLPGALIHVHCRYVLLIAIVIPWTASWHMGYLYYYFVFFYGMQCIEKYCNTLTDEYDIIWNMCCLQIQPDCLFKLLLSLEKPDCADNLSVLELVDGKKPLEALVNIVKVKYITVVLISVFKVKEFSVNNKPSWILWTCQCRIHIF